MTTHPEIMNLVLNRIHTRPACDVRSSAECMHVSQRAGKLGEHAILAKGASTIPLLGPGMSPKLQNLQGRRNEKRQGGQKISKRHIVIILN